MDLDWELAPIGDGKGPIGDGKGTLLAIDGELTIATCEQLMPATGAAVTARRPLVLDLSQCPFIDSTGLNLVLRLSRDLARSGPLLRMVIVIGDSMMRRKFLICRIDRFIPMLDTREQATEWLDTSADPAIRLRAWTGGSDSFWDGLSGTRR